MVSTISYLLSSNKKITGFGRRRIHAGSYRLTGRKIRQGYTLPDAIRKVHYPVTSATEGKHGLVNTKEYTTKD